MEQQNTEKGNKDKTSRRFSRTAKTWDILTIHYRYRRHRHQGFGIQSCHGKLRNLGCPGSLLLLVHNSLFVEI
jgi:hypothetical protein